ncbi:MAG: TatD family hydrolase [Bacilli bacterium]|jgi:TatD DNase family protein|nr:TatD family hydrolase [Bacilli bacterium]
MIDSHCHLNHNSFYHNPEKHIKDAMAKGVEAFLVVGYDLESSKRALSLAKRFENVYAAVGVHPTDIKKRQQNDFIEIETMLNHPKVIGYGEIGLDYYWDKEADAQIEQKKYFIEQINLANKYKLPIIVHTRDAAYDTYKLLSDNPPQYGGIMHCYSGSAEMVGNYTELGFYISLGGPVTFLNARTPKEVAKIVPLNRLLIETDSPYLSPHPLRGKPNSPENLPLILNEIARLRNVDVTVIDKETTANFWRLFRLQND